MHVQTAEDRFPRDLVEPQQEVQAIRYELTVRLASPLTHKTRRLVVRCLDDGNAVCFIRGSNLSA